MNNSEVDNREPLTEDQMEVAFVAWGLAAKGKAFVPADEYLTAAESMRTKGWLSRQTLDNGDGAYEFTPAGETALNLSGLMRSRAAEAN
jgi:hypothetical protein